MKTKIANTLALLEAAGLKLYGHSITQDTARAWEIALSARKVNPDFIDSACGWFLANESDFPSASKFCDVVLRLEAESRPPLVMRVAGQSALMPRQLRTREENKKRIEELHAKMVDKWNRVN